jgi:hypothetical protein
MQGYSIAERFWAKVDKLEPDGCWEWTAFKQPAGYGTFQLHGRSSLAHRVAYELEHGPIPNGLEIDHLCKNPSCVRPSHLEAVTREENMRRAPSWGGFANKAKTHCLRGHAYDEGNTVHLKGGGRTCLICKRERNRKYEHDHRAIRSQ